MGRNILLNDNLQAMLAALYDYWFLQFDFPDENGKPYHSSGGKMVWNDRLKCDIPDGWDVKPLSKLVEHICTGLNPRNNFTLGHGRIRYVTVKNLTNDGSIDFAGCDCIDEHARKKVHARSRVSKGDVLFASIAPLGRCHLVMDDPEDWDINESVFSIRANSISSPEYLYSFLTSDYFVRCATHQSTGSIFKGIRINALLDTYLLVPKRSTLVAYSKKAHEIMRAMAINSRENASLTSLRDWLLPMLMNGQATVRQPQANYRLAELLALIATRWTRGDGLVR